MPEIKKRSVVLLSAGLDSTVNLYEAHQKTEVIMALTFDYGQRAAARETEMARQQCRHLGLSYQVVALPFFAGFTKTSLVNRASEVPVGDRVRIDDRPMSEDSAKAVWVPNRNGIFLNTAAGFAEGLGADLIVPGFNVEEAATFPDNTAEFLEATSRALAFSTANQVRAVCYTTSMNKTEIMRRGIELGVQFQFVWPCYLGGSEICGECESCQRYKRAQRAVGL